MVIRRLALPAVIAASGLMVLGAVSAQATTAIRTDPGGALLTGTTTIRNTSSSPGVLTTNLGTVTCTTSRLLGTAFTNFSATSITGTGRVTVSQCVDTMPVVNFTSCEGHGAFPRLTATATATGGIFTIGDSVARCAISGSSNACYYTSASTTAIGNNATSSISVSNVTAVSVAATSDSLGSGICGSSNTFSVTLTHAVNQSNQTLTITTS